MKAKVEPPVSLVEAEDAIECLLETLLSEVPDHYVDDEITTADDAALEISEVPPEIELNIAELQPIPLIETSVEMDSQVLPDWAEESIKVLIVNSGGQRFGIPLVTLNSIVPVNHATKLTQIPGQPQWHRGVMAFREGNLIVADLGDLLDLGLQEERPAYLLVIADNTYAVTCATLEEPVTLRKEDIKWRQQGDKRDWSFGVIPEQMCVLLDVDAISKRFT